MNRRFIPYCVAKSVYDIDPGFFKKNGVATVFIDLDNTLDPYNQPLPSQRAKDLKLVYEALGIELILVSNNTSKRVAKYAGALATRYIGSLGKPFSFKLRKYIAKFDIDTSKTMMIGDQIMTDVGCGNGAGVRTILTERLVDDDQWTTRFNRFFDRHRLRKMQKLSLLTDWRNK